MSNSLESLFNQSLDYGLAIKKIDLAFLVLLYQKFVLVKLLRHFTYQFSQVSFKFADKFERDIPLLVSEFFV